MSRLFSFMLIAFASASPIVERQADSSLIPYSLPDNGDIVIRTTGIDVKRTTFTYGPAVGAGPYSPAGALGVAAVATDSLISNAELGAQVLVSSNDSLVAKADSAKYNNLTTLEDYTKLYDGEWQPSSRPTGQDAGILTNYTQDLLFSMERLSFNPYAVRRLDPVEDALPFTIADSTATNITGQTLNDLFIAGRLFYADHSNQSTLEKNAQFSAACDAYFYISSVNGDFLPLAIRTNVGNNLIYTPEDTANDWLLAKMMFNENDFFMGQLDHFARTHFVAEISYFSAVRTLSDDHPVLALMKRFLYASLGTRPLALATLLSPGADFDKFFGLSGAAAAKFSNDTYWNGYSGAIKANYFRNNLRTRGLIDSTTGPALKSFPFYEDAAPISDAIREFTGSFVDSYYADASRIAGDPELQAWLVEANGPAATIDFPDICSPCDLADFLAQIGHLVSLAHHSVNLNQLITGSGTLPFHPWALYKPVPDAKGVQDVVSYLPPIDKALGLIEVAANFARPLLASTNRTLIHMFDDAIMLSRSNAATRAANEKFMEAMRNRSRIVSSRGFDGDGLSQGMPFVWKALDPGVIPWSLSV